MSLVVLLVCFLLLGIRAGGTVRSPAFPTNSHERAGVVLFFSARERDVQGGVGAASKPWTKMLSRQHVFGGAELTPGLLQAVR